MAYGIIIQGEDRPDIVYENGTTRGGLHCGDCIDMLVEEWVSARIEYDNEWVVVIKNKKYPVPYGSICKE